MSRCACSADGLCPRHARDMVQAGEDAFAVGEQLRTEALRTIAKMEHNSVICPAANPFAKDAECLCHVGIAKEALGE